MLNEEETWLIESTLGKWFKSHCWPSGFTVGEAQTLRRDWNLFFFLWLDSSPAYVLLLLQTALSGLASSFGCRWVNKHNNRSLWRQQKKIYEKKRNTHTPLNGFYLETGELQQLNSCRLLDSEIDITSARTFSLHMGRCANIFLWVQAFLAGESSFTQNAR